MDEVFKYLLRPGTFVVAIMVVICTFFVKRIAEIMWPSLKKHAKEMDNAPMYLTKASLWWNEVVLYLLPVVFGMSAGLSGSEFINSDIDTTGARFMFNAGIGWFSGTMYKILKKIIQNKTGVDLEGDTIVIERTKTETETKIILPPDPPPLPPADPPVEPPA